MSDNTFSSADESTPGAQPAATSTPEQSADNSTSLRRSQRLKATRVPCDCCTTGMHVRCYTSITGRRPLHTSRTSAVRRSLQAKRMPRINATEAVERPASARSRNNSGSSTRNTRSIKRRRPLFESPEARR
ncbi:hypothetical protein KR093_006813 [Drosophila rubida]|uniref:Uncharacterized protein n=1 Tax=Drosophila rubida TaxID=30044 RepID=A0AAD4K531_9MUSC|nr:hypothetical protein KR093_006813 [Drosophila rubida]